ncbi:hypothetical protein HPP92_021802 [Vanilla planifolia]|uniref:Protein FLX-like 2 n=1 Tax=Vanilla planifolia TaxID=51239 RepID=A0A835PZJ5_VANPL|nr:hypothetical protein HPP92_021802 [Vanilla planifolia]
MASRGHIPSPFLGKSVQVPGLMRHGPLSGYPPTHRPLEAVAAAEQKVAVQEAEMDRLALENRRLAASHVALRQELVATQQELQRIHSHIGNIHNDGDIQVRGFLEKLAKAGADASASETVRKELQQAHLEAQSLVAQRQEIATEIQHLTEGLQKAKVDVKRLPEMHAEIEALRQEHQQLRASFEYEKHLNKEQVEQMCGMEKNLITMAKEIEKLRADVLSVEKAARVTYGTGASAYPSTGHAYAGYPDQAYSQGSVYAENTHGLSGRHPSSGYSHAGVAGYPQGYGMGPSPVPSGVAVQGVNPYGSSTGGVYADGPVMGFAPVAGGTQGVGTGNSSAGVNTGSHDGVGVGAPPLPPGPPPPAAGWR